MKLIRAIHLNFVSKPVGLHVHQLMTAATWILIALALSHNFPALATKTEADALLRSGWWPRYMTSNTSVSHCTWLGISCDNSGSVVEINLPEPEGYYFCRETPVDLSSMDFSLLPNLTSLRLVPICFAGVIPLQICVLPKLKHLNLSNNYLIGELPLCLQNLTMLEVIDIHDNKINSSLPAKLGNLERLIYLDLSFNLLNGMIPTTLAKLKNLTYLYLQGNSLYGSIPPEMGNLTSLKFLDLQGNSFVGPIPSSIAKLRKLTHFYLQRNSFNGSIPSEIGNLTSLEFLDLHGNSFVGPIPSEIGNLTSLEFLDLHGNSFVGPIPSSIAKLRNLTYFYLQWNCFNGTIPLEIGNLTSLVYLNMKKNKFSGCIPSEIGNLKSLIELNLSSNSFTGPIPPKIGDLKSLAGLDLSFNNFSGKIPYELESLSMLSYLNLSGNSLHGLVPKFKKLHNLDCIDFSYNHLTGIVPQNLFNIRHTYFKGNEGLKIMRTELDALLLSRWWPDHITSSSLSHCMWPGISCDDSGSVFEINAQDLYYKVQRKLSRMNFSLLPNLASLRLTDNFLTGIIPLHICSLPKLRHLNLSYNELTGELPFCLQNLTMLEVIDIHVNQIVCPIPPKLGSLKRLIHLDLHENQFNCAIPSEIGLLKSLTHLDLSNNNFSREIPYELESLFMLSYLNLANNSLHGSIPKFRELSNLDYIDMSYNHLMGIVPHNLFNIRYTNFKGNEGLKFPEELDVLLWSGWWLDSIASFGESYCRWPGISCDDSQSVVGINNLQQGPYNDRVKRKLSSMNFSLLLNLVSLRLTHNFLTGKIPLQICALPKLRHLDLSSNELTGELPLCLQNLTMLEVIDIHNNQIVCPIPPKLASLKRLIYLDLHKNQFNCAIPSEIGLLKSLIHLDLSSNNFFGKIPHELESLFMLSYLNLANNSLHGSIPNFKMLLNLSYIDLSYNNLTGNIPENLAHVPHGYFQGNEDLEKNVVSKGMLMIVLIPLMATAFIFFLILGYCSMFRRRMKSKQLETIEKNGDFLSIWNYDGRIAYEDIINATEDFDIKYCIGTGGYGSVYRAQLPNGKIVALKKLHRLEAEDPSFDQSFRNEVKHLTEVRHRSIIKLHGFCLHRRCMFLVYEYMQRGSLFCALRDDIEAVELDWSKRLNIVWDMAHALSYLHHGCARSIVHRDVSSNNILLDNKMQAFLSDFGTARFLESNFLSNLTANIVGTHGYIAPALEW
ncbi:hypothetical protein BT93_I1044 [Corymbia citriodora subsp. variegata]|nr:hypothetical protein BT93_I1044 [Corymbia citriodora subsp. variegata]